MGDLLLICLLLSGRCQATACFGIIRINRQGFFKAGDRFREVAERSVNPTEAGPTLGVIRLSCQEVLEVIERFVGPSGAEQEQSK